MEEIGKIVEKVGQLFPTHHFTNSDLEWWPAFLDFFPRLEIESHLVPVPELSEIRDAPPGTAVRTNFSMDSAHV